MICVAIDLLQEHLAPEVLFSAADFSHVHWRAAFSPQEHLASFAQAHPPSRPQPGTAVVVEDILVEVVVGCWLEWMEVMELLWLLEMMLMIELVDLDVW